MKRPGLFRMLLRGLFRRCPMCAGRGAFFTGWYKKADCCQTCGLEWRRGDVGYELGAAAMLVIITFGPLMVLLGVMVAITWPEVAVIPMFVVLVALAIGLPLVLYGSSYIMWQGIDLTMREPTLLDYRSVDHPVPTSDTDAT